MRSITSAVVLVSGTLITAAAAQPLSVGKPVRYDGDVVARVHVRGLADLQRLEKWSADPWSCSGPGLGEVDYRLPRERLADLDAAGIPYRVTIENVQTLIEAENARFAGPRLADAAFFSEYRTYDQISTYVNQLVADFPTRARRLTLGTSLGPPPGAPLPIFAIEVAAPNAPADRPVIFMHGLQHAREWITGATTTFIADALLRRYGSDPGVTAALDRFTVVIVPVMNPDGYNHTWAFDRLWRKNRRPNSNGSIGVDLNRNWSVGWGVNLPGFPVGSSGNPNSATYRGPAAFSEPETRALRDFMTANPRVVAHFDVHSFSQLILSPFGYTNEVIPNNAFFLELNAVLQNGIRAVNGLVYRAGPTFTTIYPAAGVSQDWSFGTLGLLSFGFELRDTGQTGFLLPPDQIVPNSEEMLGGLVAFATRIGAPPSIAFPAEAPTLVEADQPTTITIRAGVGWQAPGTVTPRVSFRIGRVGFFTTADAAPAAPPAPAGDFTFTFPPAPCGSDITYTITAQARSGHAASLPADGLLAPIVIRTGTRALPNGPLTACAPCPTDFNLDAVNNQEDLGAFVTAWLAGEPAADYSGDAVVDQEDLGPYITDYFESLCPGA